MHEFYGEKIVVDEISGKAMHSGKVIPDCTWVLWKFPFKFVPYLAMTGKKILHDVNQGHYVMDFEKKRLREQEF